MGAFLGRQREHMLIEDLTVHLIRWQPHLIKGADFAAPVEFILRSMRKPEPQPILGDMVMTKVMCQREALGKKAAADLGSGFTDFAVKMC